MRFAVRALDRHLTLVHSPHVPQNAVLSAYKPALVAFYTSASIIFLLMHFTVVQNHLGFLRERSRAEFALFRLRWIMEPTFVLVHSINSAESLAAVTTFRWFALSFGSTWLGARRGAGSLLRIGALVSSDLTIRFQELRESGQVTVLHPP